MYRSACTCKGSNRSELTAFRIFLSSNGSSACGGYGLNVLYAAPDLNVCGGINGLSGENRPLVPAPVGDPTLSPSALSFGGGEESDITDKESRINPSWKTITKPLIRLSLSVINLKCSNISYPVPMCCRGRLQPSDDGRGRQRFHLHCGCHLERGPPLLQSASLLHAFL